MTSTLFRLAFAGLRTRLLATALTVLLAAAATCTLVLVLEVRETGRDPWERTFAAAHGAHVLANVPTSAAAESLRALDGVTEAGDPVPVTTVELTTSRSTEPLRIGGLSGTPTVNAPIVTSGTAEPGDGVVLERSLARALGLAAGDRLHLRGPGGEQEVEVVGTAILPSQSRFPRPIRGSPGWPGRPWSGCSPTRARGAGTRRCACAIPPRHARWPTRWSSAPRPGPSLCRPGRTSGMTP